MTRERRRSRRVEVMGDLAGTSVRLDEPIVIKEMSAGGLTIATKFPFKVGSTQEFRVTRDHESTLLKGRVVHQRVTLDRDEVSYISGIQFDDSTALQGWLRDLLDEVEVEA